MNWKVITTRQIEQILYGCRIPDYCWSRTVFHDEWPVVSTLCQETKKHHNQKDGSKGTQRLGPYWKLQPVAYKVNMELRSELSLWTKTVRISHGLNKLVTNLNHNEQETSECSSKNMRLKLNAGDFASVSKAKAKPQKLDFGSSSTRTIPIGERTWTRLNHKIIRPPVIQCRRNWSIFFVMETYVETNYGAIEFWRIKDHLQNHFQHCHHWSDDKWKKSWQEEEETRKDTSIVMIHQEQFFTSELSNVIQDAILLILHYRTMLLFRTVSSSTYITSDVQSIYISSSILDWYREAQILSKRQTVFLSACGSHGQKP